MGYSPWSGKELDTTEGLSMPTHIPGRASDSQLSVAAEQTNLRLAGQPRNWALTLYPPKPLLYLPQCPNASFFQDVLFASLGKLSCSSLTAKLLNSASRAQGRCPHQSLPAASVSPCVILSCLYLRATQQSGCLGSDWGLNLSSVTYSLGQGTRPLRTSLFSSTEQGC